MSLFRRFIGSLIDKVLIMSVYPGRGGQTFIEDTYKKILRVKKVIVSKKVKVKISVDGGVNDEIAKKLDFAIFFANRLRKYLIEDEVDIENWDINIDKILENIDELKKLNPTKKLKFLEFILPLNIEFPFPNISE